VAGVPESVTGQFLGPVLRAAAGGPGPGRAGDWPQAA
jgi:hypothetical protein